MPRATDDSENVEFHGIITVLPHPIPSGGDGSVELSGKLYTDFIESNTIGEPVDINGINIIESTISITNKAIQPNNPVVDETLFYIKDTLLRSLDSDGVLTTYQPTNTKGDITGHNGVTQIRLPIGVPDSFLVSDPTTPTGLNWIDPDYSLDKTRTRVSLSDTGIESSSIVVDRVYSSVFAMLSPFMKNGASGVFVFSKSRDSIHGHSIRLSSTPNPTTGGHLESLFDPYEPPEVYKNYSGSNGDYSLITSYNYIKTSITLTGTTWISLGGIYSVTTGSFFVSIYSDDNGPCASFLLCKSSSDFNSSAINRISNSPGADNGQIELRWSSGSGIEIRKTTVSNDSNYNVVDNFQKNTSRLFQLNGTVPVFINKIYLRYYEKRDIVIRIRGIANDSPCSMYFITKNNRTTNGSKYSIFSPGKTSLEKVEVDWNPNSFFSIKKNGLNYDGDYIVEYIKFNYLQFQ
jgi:hypothetical protein